MQPLFILIVGHDISGKTTIAKKLEADLRISRIGGDELRRFLKSNVRYFKDAGPTYSNEKARQMTPFLVMFRKQLTAFLLRSGQSVICDGRGATKAMRKDLLDHARLSRLTVKTVIVYTDLSERELPGRIKKHQREDSGTWLDMYRDVRKQQAELPPHTSEADIIIKYNQRNYGAVRTRLEKLLNAPQPNSV